MYRLICDCRGVCVSVVLWAFVAVCLCVIYINENFRYSLYKPGVFFFRLRVGIRVKFSPQELLSLLSESLSTIGLLISEGIHVKCLGHSKCSVK